MDILHYIQKQSPTTTNSHIIIKTKHSECYVHINTFYIVAVWHVISPFGLILWQRRTPACGYSLQCYSMIITWKQIFREEKIVFYSSKKIRCCRCDQSTQVRTLISKLFDRSPEGGGFHRNKAIVLNQVL